MKGSVLNHENITQELVDGVGHKYLDRLKNMGQEKSLEAYDLQMQLDGGTCKWCGAAWVEHRAQVSASRDSELVIRGDFLYFIPTCSCLRKRRDAEDHHVSVDVEIAMDSAMVPARFRALSFDKLSRDVSPAINEALDSVQTYIREARYNAGTGLLLIGPVGTGKTTAGVLALKSMMAHGLRCRFVQVSSLADQIVRSRETGGFFESMLSYNALMLDDIDKVSTESDWMRSQIFALIDAAYSEKITLVITSSAKDAGELAMKLGRDVMSRISSSSELIRFSGDDYRRKQS